MRHRHNDVIRLTGIFGAFDIDPSIKTVCPETDAQALLGKPDQN